MLFPTSSVALFCEDIREETAGGQTLVGVMPDNVSTVTTPPGDGQQVVGTAIRLCALVRTSFDPATQIENASMMLIATDGSKQVMGSFTKESVLVARDEAIKRKLPLVTVITKIQMVPFLLPPPGVMRLEATINSVTYLCGFINFVAGETVT